jgi:hypothetical protein
LHFSPSSLHLSSRSIVSLFSLLSHLPSHHIALFTPFPKVACNPSLLLE